MDEPGHPERPSVLGSGDLPNASNRVIATVLGVCAIAAVLLVLVVAFAVNERMGEPSKPIGHPPPIAAKPVPPPQARQAPPADPNDKSAPARGEPVSFFFADDYPVEALRRSEQGRAVARLALDSTGKVVRCNVATSSGSASLDAATCRIALERVRYRPALDRDGRPIASSVTLPVRWVLPDEPPSSDAPANEDAPPRWLSLLFGALAAFEGFTVYRGWTSGRIEAPRSSATAVRETSPALFMTYVSLHILFALVCGALAFVCAIG